MSGPTLFKKGKLKAHDYSEPQEILDTKVPIDYIMNWFAPKIKAGGKSAADRIMILESSTGSGKSTVIPPEFFHRFFEDTGKRNICCTQPKVLTSEDIPKTILPFHSAEAFAKMKSKRTPLKMGLNIGFQNGTVVKKPVRGIIFMTIGVLQQQLNIMTDEAFCDRYSIIIVDEVHNRSIGTDFTLFMLKKLIERNYSKRNCPFLVATSATFDIMKFTDYLLSSVPKPERYKNIIKVEGLSFPIKDEFIKYDSNNYIMDAVNLAKKLHMENPEDFGEASQNSKLKLKEDIDTHFRDILIFVSGSSEVKKIVMLLERENQNNSYFNKYPVLPLPLMGEDVVEKTSNYANLDKPIEKLGVQVKYGKKITIKKPVRRVIVATSVAETGITINTLKYVIDTGFLKSGEYNPEYRISLLVTQPVTKSMHIQRRGRVGRKAPGNAYFLYTKENFEKMINDEFPSIIKEDIILDVLGLIVKASDTEGEYNKKTFKELFSDSQYLENISSGKINVYNFDILDSPSADSLHSAIDRLYNLGAINKNITPTAVGIIMNRFRFISPESIKMLISGFAWKAPIIDLISAVVMVNFAGYSRFFIKSGDIYKKNIKKNLLNWGNENWMALQLQASCDFIVGIIIWNKFQELINKEVETGEELAQAWCENLGISYSILLNCITARDDIIYSLTSMGFNPYENFHKSYKFIGKENLLDWINSIKQCIFEGYKNNIAIWNANTKSYFTRIGQLELNPDRLWLTDKRKAKEYNYDNAKYIIYSGIAYRQSPKTSLYDPDINYCTVLDGYVVIDSKFDY